MVRWTCSWSARSPGSGSAPAAPARRTSIRVPRWAWVARRCGSGSAARRCRCGRSPPSSSDAELDRSVFAGEAGGRWLWIVLRPASAMLLLRGRLDPARRLGHRSAPRRDAVRWSAGDLVRGITAHPGPPDSWDRAHARPLLALEVPDPSRSGRAEGAGDESGSHPACRADGRRRPTPSSSCRPGPCGPHRPRRRIHDRQRDLRAAVPDGGQRRPCPVADRLGDHGPRDADAGLRLPDAGDPQAGRRRRRLRLRPGRLRELRRLHLGLGVLGQRVGRQRRLPGPDGFHARLLLAVVRRGEHVAGDPGRLGGPVGRPCPDPARRAQRGCASTPW